MKKLDLEIRQVNNGFVVYHGLCDSETRSRYQMPEMWVAEDMNQLLRLLSKLYLELENAKR